MEIAITAEDMDQLVAEGIEALAAYRDAEASAQQRRYELGRVLVRARARWPRSGPNAKGWGDYLARVGVDQDVALLAMKYTGWVDEHVPEFSRQADGKSLPSLAETGLRPPPPATADLGAPPATPPAEQAADPSAVEADADPDIDRDTWCTPRWITEKLGAVDLDPCANERSHVEARETYRLDQGQDGLELAIGVDSEALVFINPPYSDVRPWIDAYAHTRFVFLLKLDPSTKWFAALFEATGRVLIPRGTRVQFEPPPGVPPEKAHANPFPHALFFARAADAPRALVEQCFDWITNPN